MGVGGSNLFLFMITLLLKVSFENFIVVLSFPDRPKPQYACLLVFLVSPINGEGASNKCYAGLPTFYKMH